ncbi:MAG: M14 family metallopeptidase [Burkholderiaceae bacterium]
MIGAVESFSPTYKIARARFLEAAAQAGLQVESFVHPEKGREGEEIAMDVALDGPADAERLLIVTSACHGVEGYCGTGVQRFALHDEEWRKAAREKGVSVLYVHALNPYGFSHVSRTTNENCDLNRNFHDFSQPLPVNEAYREIHSLLLPDTWPPTPENTKAIGDFIATRGQAAYQAAITRGQHEFPDGLFFGGTSATWSNRTIRHVLNKYGAKAKRIAWIDIHTGLGPNGVAERIYAGADDKQAVARARKWWDGGGTTPVTSIYDGTSNSAFLTGLMWTSILEECPHAEYTGIAMEYGTLPIVETLQALRGEHWLRNNRGTASPEVAAKIKQELMDAFFTDTDEWKKEIIRQGRESLFQAAEGLSS